MTEVRPIDHYDVFIKQMCTGEECINKKSGKDSLIETGPCDPS
jgi:hypothetical protein